ncbi:MAG: glycoside hydrolase family 2 TIM barrel-domain containing protein [bacterium]
MIRFTKNCVLSFYLITAVMMLLNFTCVYAADWKSVESPLMTRWTKEVTPDNVLPAYPRPQMMRGEWLNLNGLWEYAIRSSDAGRPEVFDGLILVPFPVESALSGVVKPVSEDQSLWYRRTFDVPASWEGKHILLHFGAVDWETAVWVNGARIGGHKGGYDSFTLDITEVLTSSGQQEIVLRVWDPTDKGAQPRGKQVQQPQGIWYTPTTGIWQTVWLEPVPKTYIQSIKVTPDVDNSAVEVVVDISGAQTGYIVIAELVAPAENDRMSRQILSGSGSPGSKIKILFPADQQPKLWSPDFPHLYDLNIKLHREKEGSPFGDAVDRISSYLGMRKVSIETDSSGTPRIFLNGKPLFMYGVLDQGFWPDGIYTAPTDEALRYDIETIKRLGFNLARKHVKIEPDRWYYWCDKLGLLVWQDMPSGDRSPGVGEVEITREKESAEQHETEMRRMIDSLYNHPSIVMWVVFNEGWGQYDTMRLTEWIKNYDSSRLVNNASGWNDMKAGDIKDIHHYPEPASPEIESERAGVLGEFGGLGLSVEGHTWQEGLKRLGGAAGGENWGYRKMEGMEQLWRQYKNLLVPLGQLIRWKGLSGAVYTQITDVEIEVNGLLTYDREVLKFDAGLMATESTKLYQLMEKSQEEELKIFIPTSEQTAQRWRFTTKEPAAKWNKLEFDDSNWQKGEGGFGMIGTPGAQVRTIWNMPQIWLRQTFDWTQSDCGELLLSVHHDEDAQIYINGVLAATASGFVTSYYFLPVAAEAAAAIKHGKNVLAVTCKQTGGGQYIDVGISGVCKKSKSIK